MGNCLEIQRHAPVTDEECRRILQHNPWMRSIPFISCQQQVQPLPGHTEQHVQTNCGDRWLAKHEVRRDEATRKVRGHGRVVNHGR